MGRGTVNVTPPAMATPGGTATLDENGKIPVEQIPDIYSDEHIKDISPTSTSCATLLAYIASRYADHPVIDGYVSGFSDLPDGVTGGQVSISMSGTVVIVELHTADKVYKRTTTSTTAWTSEWKEQSAFAAVTLTVSGWSSGVQTVTVAGLATYANAIVSLPDDISDEAYDAACAAALKVTSQSGTSVTITASETVPTVDIPLLFILFG